MSEEEIMLRLAPDGDEFDVVGDDDHGSGVGTSPTPDDEDEESDYEFPDVYDDFPMSLEYDGLWGASDFENDQASAREDEYEREMYGGY
jgi:hypothetical protein